jgi:acetyl-CoA carboxylase biotin carboxyl carrier protein
MTLAEIAEIIARSRAANLTAVEYQAGGSFLRLRWTSGGVERDEERAGLEPEETSTVVTAPCSGVFRLAHPERAHLPLPASAVQGEIIGYLQVGPCLRAVEAPCPGNLRLRVEENRLVGYGEPLFEIEPRSC